MIKAAAPGLKPGTGQGGCPGLSEAPLLACRVPSLTMQRGETWARRGLPVGLGGGPAQGGRLSQRLRSEPSAGEGSDGWRGREGKPGKAWVALLPPPLPPRLSPEESALDAQMSPAPEG